MQAGCHVLVEKPMALNTRDAERMVAVAQEQEVSLATNHNYLYKPSVEKARSFVEQGDIGEVVSVYVYYGISDNAGVFIDSSGLPHWPRNVADSIFDNYLPHVLYLQREFLQEIGSIAGVTVHRMPAPGELPTDLTATFEGARGTGNICVSMRAKPYAKFVEVYGTKGILHADLVREVCTIHKDSPMPGMLSKALYNLESSAQLTFGTIVNTANVLTRRMKSYPGLHKLVPEFYQSIREDREPPVTGEDGLEMVRVLEKIWSQASPRSSEKKKPHLPENLTQPQTEIERQILEGGGLKGKVLVTGANGFLGSHLVSALSRCGAQVVALVRDSGRSPHFMDQQADILLGDLRKPETLAAAMKGVDTLIHCAAITTNKARWSEHEDINIKGTENVLEAALEAGAKKVVHVSSVVVYGLDRPRGGKDITEDFPYAKNPDKWALYLRSKLEADKVAFKYWHDHSLPVTIMRLGILYGPGGGRPPGRGLVQIGSFRMLVGSGRNFMPYTYIDNAVDSLLLAAVDSNSAGQAFNIVDEPQLPLREVALSGAKIANQKVRLIPIPTFALNSGARIFELISDLGGSDTPPKLSRYAIHSSFRNVRYSTEKARKQLNWQSGVDLETGLGYTLGLHRR
jgi:nucleoside-diphosphate-sugar epimerase/predicted dehydrogenase